MLGVFVTMMWCIWSSMNKFTRGEEGFQPMRSIALVDEIVATLELPLCQNDPGGSRQHPTSHLGWVAVNVDGAVDVQSRVVGSGHVVRDYLGETDDICECFFLRHFVLASMTILVSGHGNSATYVFAQKLRRMFAGYDYRYRNIFCTDSDANATTTKQSHNTRE
uniref:Uncharacterized protein n=1 Tax=Aegilops tauschii subsp. strangulata TaxID=200361 RepID=A0A453LBP9_AEGTS